MTEAAQRRSGDRSSAGIEKLVLETRGATIVGDRAQLPGAPVLIFSHGAGQTRHSWRGAMAAVWREGFEAVSLDLRGHGESSWPQAVDYALERFAEDINTAVRIFAHGRPVGLIGASFGGMMSLLAAAMPGSTVQAVAIVDIVPRVAQDGASRVRLFMEAHADGFASLEEAALEIAAYRGVAVPRGTAGLEKNLQRRDNGRWYWHWDPAFLRSLRRGQERLDQLEAAAATYKGPLLLVHGLKSDVVGADGIAALRAIAPQLEYVDVAQAGHMIVSDRNDAFVAAVCPFMGRHLGLAPDQEITKACV